MDQDNALELAGVLCARVCHDLAGTLGALSGMLDLVAETGDQDALVLAQDCAREASARLRLLRAAWGTDADVPDLATLLPGLPNAAKLAVNLAELDELESDAVRQLAACLLLVAAGALPLGGSIWLAGAGRQISVRIDGRRAAWPDGLTGAARPQAEPRTVGVVMARLRAESLGIGLRAVSDLVLEAVG